MERKDALIGKTKSGPLLICSILSYPRVNKLVSPNLFWCISKVFQISWFGLCCI